jgi:hypothetical protein
MNNWTLFHLEHFQAHCKNSVSLSTEIRFAFKGPWYRVSLSVPFQVVVQSGRHFCYAAPIIMKPNETRFASSEK